MYCIIFPKVWQQARIVPIFKQDNRVLLYSSVTSKTIGSRPHYVYKIVIKLL